MLNYKLLNQVDKLNNEDITLINYCRFTNNFDKLESVKECMVNSKEVFDSINNIGRRLLNNIFDVYKEEISNGYSIYHLINSFVLDYQNTILEEYKIWITDNGYPYSYVHYKDNGVFGYTYFVKDSIILSLIFEIFIWINKIIKLEDNTEVDDTLRFENLLNLINIKEVILSDSSTWISRYGYQFNIDKELLLFSNIKESINKDKSSLFSSARRILLTMVNNRFNNKDFIISKQTPIYIKEQDCYHICCSSNSLMGIAYYYLLLTLSSLQYEFKEKICKSPHCINFFEAEGNQRYCNECRNKNISNILKNRKYNNSPNGISKRETYYKTVIKKQRIELKKASHND